MKFTLFCATTIAVTVWSCSGIFDEQTTATLNQGGGDAALASYLVEVTMKNDQNASKDVTLSIYRDNSGNPTCVGVSGFGNQKHYVPLKKHGSGEWRKVGTSGNADGTYDRYRNAHGERQLDITLHWTKERGDMQEAAMAAAITEAKHSRLEYLSASLKSDSIVYEYQNDADGRSSLAIGTLADTPSQSDFNPTCDS